MPAFETLLQLAEGAEVVETVELVVPNTPAATYHLGVVTDLTQVLAETLENSRNNVTRNLVSIGELAHTIAGDERDPINGIDLYHEVQNKVDLRNGRASHSSRMIMRGDRNSVTWNNGIWARFMMINLADMTAQVSDYNGGSVDKHWGAIAWNNEHDAQGRDIQVDYYGNSPSIQTLTAGEYLMVVLLNSRDLLPEVYPENNINLTRIVIDSPRIRQNPQIWLVAEPGQAATQALTFQTPYASSGDPRPWAIEVPQNSVFSVDNTSGTFSSSSASVTSTFTLSADAEVGETTSQVQLIENGATEHATTVPVRTFVLGDERAELTLPATELTFTSEQAVDATAQTLTLQNTGNAPLHFALEDSEPWLTLSHTSGTIAPGASFDVTVNAWSFGLRPGGQSGVISIYNNTANSHTTLNTRYNIERRTN